MMTFLDTNSVVLGLKAGIWIGYAVTILIMLFCVALLEAIEIRFVENYLRETKQTQSFQEWKHKNSFVFIPRKKLR